MPKLPVIKDKQLIKILNKLGFIKHRQKGTSHLVMIHLDGRRTVISIHPSKDIPRGTLKAILRDIEITNNDFTDLL
ncbi:MAG: type II toxin-antitoxin system HicA family toxin [Candidatus Omnitrophica bacterium]|nr:type II toxin-antitoxin system HicA family toxin [Candidatus Omnitrophota bacterium]